MKIRLSEVAHARSGDKGDVSNIGLIAYRPRHYDLLAREVTAERVKAHFGALVEGPVRRYELPNLYALNFVMEKALDGGGTISLRTDAQGKTHGAKLLTMEIEAEPDEFDR
ncbi:MAG: AtuA-related protein [Bryobacteraceae bacterium]